MAIPIPSASMSGVNFEHIKLRYPEYLDEIRRLGSLVNEGNDTDDNFLQLCRLLLTVGERSKAWELLLANGTAGDPDHVLFQAEFPDAAVRFAQALATFADQFACELSLIRSSRLLSGLYHCRPTRKPSFQGLGEITQDIAACDAEITYEVTGDIVADIDTPSESIPYRLVGKTGNERKSAD